MNNNSSHSAISNSDKPALAGKTTGPALKSLGIVACGALAHEIEAITKANRFRHIFVRYLPAKLHNTPTQIPEAVDAALDDLKSKCDLMFVAYGDCGTAGKLDVILKKHNVTRLKGYHCYEFFTGSRKFEILHDAQPGTFYLTDYLARQFDTLVYKPLGLDRHPQLLDEYFGNYTRLVYLAQTESQILEDKARDAAKRLELEFEKVITGFGQLETELTALARSPALLKSEH